MRAQQADRTERAGVSGKLSEGLPDQFPFQNRGGSVAGRPGPGDEKVKEIKELFETHSINPDRKVDRNEK